MSRLMTKQTMWLCAQRRFRSAWASAQSDEKLRCPPEGSLGPKLPIKRTAKTLTRLGWSPGWSESSLGAQSFCWFCHEAAQVSFLKRPNRNNRNFLSLFWFKLFCLAIALNNEWTELNHDEWTERKRQCTKWWHLDRSVHQQSNIILLYWCTDLSGWGICLNTVLILFLRVWMWHCLSIRFSPFISCTNEPPHDKTNKMTVRPANTQISLGIRPVWSESSLLCSMCS